MFRVYIGYDPVESVAFYTRALQLDKDAGRIKAKVLFLPAKTDLLFPPDYSRKAADKLRAQGNPVELYEIDGTNGHLDGIFSIGKVADRIKGFLEK